MKSMVCWRGAAREVPRPRRPAQLLHLLRPSKRGGRKEEGEEEADWAEVVFTLQRVDRCLTVASLPVILLFLAGQD